MPPNTYISYERLEGKSQLLVQPARPCHRWWRHSTESYSGGLLGGCRFFNLKTTNFKPDTKKLRTSI